MQMCSSCSCSWTSWIEWLVSKRITIKMDWRGYWHVIMRTGGEGVKAGLSIRLLLLLLLLGICIEGSFSAYRKPNQHHIGYQQQEH